MKAVIMNLGEGRPEVVDVPEPALLEAGVLVRTACSVISSGTERGMIGLARKSLLGKARDRPDQVRQVLSKLRRDGPAATWQAVRSRLDRPQPLGYSSAGKVIAVGRRASRFAIGSRVACGGAGYANHAEVVFVPSNLCVEIPDTVSLEAASFATIGAIALEGQRLARLELGETVVIIGLGLVGLLAVQLARAAGCRVVGMDLDEARCRLGAKLGAELVVDSEDRLITTIETLTGGHGADKILVAAATAGSGPIELAGKVARERGVIVAIGDVGLNVPRRIYYEKELTLRVSRSYGPGRYDHDYEEKGRDYPFQYVRWTENRNMQAFLDQMAAGRIDTQPLISHRFGIGDAEEAYSLISGESHSEQLAVVLTYPEAARGGVSSGPEPQSRSGGPEQKEAGLPPLQPRLDVDRVGIGVLGAGAFAQAVLLPELSKQRDLELVSVATASGATAAHAASRFGFLRSTTDAAGLVTAEDIHAILVTTRHYLHAGQVLAALRAGKDVFVEKPLCLTESELAEIETEVEEQTRHRGRPPVLLVGHNRRFAPMMLRVHAFVERLDEPLVMQYRVNAGFLPKEHWTQDPEQGGGRVLGEVCHFVDSLCFLAEGAPKRVFAASLPSSGRYCGDNLVATVEFSCGSVGVITYLANGSPLLAKERLEVSSAGSSAVLDNFRCLELLHSGRREVVRSRFRQDKGHSEELARFVAAVRTGGTQPVPFADTVSVSRTTFAILRSLELGSPVAL